MKQQRDLIIFHYHLLPGGVTDVIRLSLQAFCEDSQFESITIVCGRKENLPAMDNELNRIKATSAPPVPTLSIRVVPELDYLDTEDPPPLSAEELQNLLVNNFGGDQSIWLIHNYHLGKTWLFTKSLLALAEKNSQKMIFQIHDFPECGRFANLKLLKDNISGSLYTDAPSVRYCVINKRDYDLLLQAGISPSRLFLLENPLSEERHEFRSDGTKKTKIMKKLSSYAPAEGIFHREGEIWLYPVRSIRRKNILEGGFIARLSEEPVNLVVTLPGVSPQEKFYSDMVEQAYAEGLIPGFWGTGALPEESGIGYKDMIAQADRIFSSSIQEGFGFMYLNAIIWNKPLIARYLDIMGGFLPLFESYPSHFYNTVLIPGKKPHKSELRKEYQARFNAIRPELKKELRESLMGQLDSFLKQDGIDFSYLSPPDQYSALQTLKKDKGYRKECRTRNHDLLNRIERMKKTDDSSHKQKLYDFYGMDVYRESFNRIVASFDEKAPEETKAGKIPPDDLLLRGFAKLEYARLLYT